MMLIVICARSKQISNPINVFLTGYLSTKIPSGICEGPIKTKVEKYIKLNWVVVKLYGYFRRGISKV